MVQNMAASVILIIMLIVFFYPITIFFRGTIVPFYVNTFYKGSVQNAYINTFSDFNSQINDLGFNILQKPPTCYNGVSDSGNAWFHYAAETVPCMQQAESQPVTVAEFFKKQWSDRSLKLNAYLLANNWVEGGSFESDTKLPNLYQSFDPQYGHQTAYAKSFGKYKCDLVIEYSNYSGRPSSFDNSEAYIRESCTRDVSFFGGYVD